MCAADPISAPPESGPTRRVVVVLGMHRSGTSAVAGCLQRLGVDFGPRLMPATEDNPRGYYEHIDLVNLHDRLLLALGRSWDDTTPFPAAGWQDEAATGRYRAEALAILRRDFPTASVWGFKDPRLCRLLSWWEPLWRQMDCAPVFVLVRRPPAEVAASLAKREGFSAAKSHLLWLRHTLEAERGTRGHPRALVDFKAFLADWRGTLARAARSLGHPWRIPSPDAEPAASHFVDPSLARSSLEIDAGETLPAWVEQADAALQTGLAGRQEEMSAKLDGISGHLRDAESLYAPDPSDLASDFRHQLDAVRRQAAWYEAEWQKAAARAEDARAKLVARCEEVERLKNRNINFNK